MKKILFITAHYPSLSCPYAGHKTAFRNLQEYDRGCCVDVIIVSNGDEDDAATFSSLAQTRLLRYEALTKWKKVRNILASGKMFPLKVMSRHTDFVTSFLRDHAAEYDVVHFEFTHAASALPLLPREAFGQAKIVVSSHDILIQGRLRERQRSLAARLLGLFDTAHTFAFEDRLYAVADEVLVQSHKDRALLESLYAVPGTKIRVIDPYLSEFTDRARSLRGTDTVEPRSLLFWGAMNREENEEAVVTFLRMFSDRLSSEGHKLYVVGNKPSPAVTALASPHVVVTGFVEDPTEIFASCAVGIVPLVAGAGIKVKTLEMLRSGMPVVSTAVGAEGIEDDNLHVTELPHFMEVIEALIAGGSR